MATVNFSRHVSISSIPCKSSSNDGVASIAFSSFPLFKSRTRLIAIDIFLSLVYRLTFNVEQNCLVLYLTSSDGTSLRLPAPHFVDSASSRLIVPHVVDNTVPHLGHHVLTVGALLPPGNQYILKVVKFNWPVLFFDRRCSG
ncbi:hypothetical protein Tcan_09221 [Toxocara canis]|uniref:Uncharacterized protein n=1 Tax=Toxocara canis TaxID=6265 RepID=A0A0B2VRX2_TOXCA|nr:hypothetical protein Tcan_09221 [Toxocara canis]